MLPPRSVGADVGHPDGGRAVSIIAQRSNGTAASQQPPARDVTRLPGARSDRRPALAALAVLLILGGALVSGLLVYRSGQRADYLMLATEVRPGQVIEASDLAVARITGEGPRVVPADRLTSIVGQRSTVHAFPGTLATADMFTRELALPPGALELGISVAAGRAPAGGVRVGDVVRIFSVPARGNAGRPSVVVQAARVRAVGTGGDAGGPAGVAASGPTVVSVVVTEAVAPQLAMASSQSQVSLALLPPSTRPTVGP